MKRYDYYIVGAGLFGLVFAYICKKNNKKCVVVERRNHIGGNCYTEKYKDIDVHKYGAHIFHTDNKKVIDFISQFGKINNYINQPIANVDGEVYNLPFNMNMFAKVFGITRPNEATDFIKKETAYWKNKKPKNLEEQAISMVGKTIYHKFIKGYTEKQWGKKCTELPTDIIKRIPLRFTYNNNYFNDSFQGIPNDGYTSIFNKMADGIEIRLNNTNIDFNSKNIIHTGAVDEFFDYKYGYLEYRSLQFVSVIKNTDNFQGCAVMNYPSDNIPYTRSIEHKHFNYRKSPTTIVSYEFSTDYIPNSNLERYYPIGNKMNVELHKKYIKLSKREYPNITFAGRLGEYRYYDMDDTIEKAIQLANSFGLSEN